MATRQRITACCSLQSAFGGEVTLFIAYKGRHSDVITIKLTAFIQNEIPYKTCISDFLCIWKITEFMQTCLRSAVFLRHSVCLYLALFPRYDRLFLYIYQGHVTTLT